MVVLYSRPSAIRSESNQHAGTVFKGSNTNALLLGACGIYDKPAVIGSSVLQSAILSTANTLLALSILYLIQCC
jgi:hypothetical protein